MIFSWQMAEELAAAHMRELGFTDARRTPAGADRGIDVIANDAAAQVKFLSQPVGGPDIQRLRGAAHGHRNAFFYSSSGYSRQAVALADEVGVALFEYTAANNVYAMNYLAEVAGAAPQTPPEPTRQITEAELAAEALEGDIRLLRLRLMAWRWTASRGKGKHWSNMAVDPDPSDLRLPHELDRLPLDEALNLTLTSRARTLRLTRLLSTLSQDVYKIGLRTRLEVSDAELEEFWDNNSDLADRGFTVVSLDELRSRFTEISNETVELVERLLGSSSRPRDMWSVAVNEARYILREHNGYEAFKPAQILFDSVDR
ncbi:restriction endonuclease [uncultured Microbacterium sp.]|uniref:restriction endonuclease n=1 Tax=uncultured Microbacterium sp. TaxID=191216 RepID=UPI0035CBEF33